MFSSKVWLVEAAGGPLPAPRLISNLLSLCLIRARSQWRVQRSSKSMSLFFSPLPCLIAQHCVSVCVWGRLISSKCELVTYCVCQIACQSHLSCLYVSTGDTCRPTSWISRVSDSSCGGRLFVHVIALILTAGHRVQLIQNRCINRNPADHSQESCSICCVCSSLTPSTCLQSCLRFKSLLLPLLPPDFWCLFQVMGLISHMSS